MFNLNELQCKNYEELYDKLQGINKYIENNEEKETFSKISLFIEINKDLFRGNPGVAVLLDSIGIKVHQVDAKNHLINTLQAHIRQLLPSDPEHVKFSLQFFRNTISDETERIESIADWISLMKIPLASLNLYEDELAVLLTRLEYVDLTNYNFETHHLGYLTYLLLNENLKFKTKNTRVLGAIARLCAKENATGTAYLIKNFGIEDPELRTEIALLCARKDPVATALHFKKFKIVDPGDRAVIANICAQQANIAQFFENFEIEHPFVRLDIARLCAQRAGIETAAYIDNFEIESEEERAEIAHLCVNECHAAIKLIKNFKILSPVVRTKIALQCAEINAKETAKNIANFAIDDPVSLEKIARLCAMQYGGAEFIKNFTISDPLILKQVAYLCAKEDGRCTAQFIQDFGIKDQTVLAEIAKLCAEKDGSMAEFIKNFGILDPLVLEEIACICAEKNPWATVINFKHFGITDPNIRAKIAFICAGNSEGHTAEHIDNFEIENPAVLEEIARLCAKKNGGDTAEFIKNFKITKPDVIKQIACLCAKNDGVGTAYHISSFEIKDPDVLVEIASLCAQQSGGGTAFNIKKFEIDDVAIRIKIARLCAQQNGAGTAAFIKNFEIADPAILAEIACLCAKQSGVGTAGSIKNFEIDDPAIRFKIACLCAQQSGVTAGYIKDFDIREPDALIEIARLCAMQSGSNTAQFIKNFEIADPTIRAEIARLCATENGAGTALNIKNFDLSNTEELEVFSKCILSDPSSLFLMNNFSSLPDEFTKLLKPIQILKSEEPEESLRQELFNEINELINKLPLPANCLQILTQTSKEVQALPPRVQNVIGLWLVASLVAMRSLTNDSATWMIDSGIWRELALLHDPRLRIHLSSGLYELSADEERRKTWGAFCSSVRRSEGQRGLMLLAIPLFALHKQGIPEERSIEIATSLAKFQKENTSSLRSVYHTKNILHTMQALASNNAYSQEIKKAGFEKIFNSPEEQIIIKNIIAAKGLIQLKDMDWPTSSEDLSVLFKNSLEKVIPLEDCKVDVSQKYDEIFGSCPDPGGLLTYAAGLKTLQEPEVMTCLGKYVTSVLEGTFKEERYKTEGNPHLAKIMEFNPTLLTAWKENLSFDLEALTSSESTPVVFNPEDWLKMTLITQQHLGDTELTFVKRYLDNDSNEKEVFQKLVEQINLARKEKENTQLRKDIKDHPDEKTKLKKALKKLNEQVSADPNLAQLILEKACLNLIQKGQGAEKLILIHLLEEIDKALKQKAISHTTLSGSEFAKDVNDLMNALKEELKSKERSKEGLKVLFTDDPIDLLLCGIGESCQRLSEDAQLNKGLLGYLEDGKNRIILIKEGDKMIARCMLKILWDGEQLVLYREIFYPKILPLNHQVALNNLAKKVAKKLNLPLTSKEGDTPYGKDLEALGGPAPYEYSDGCDHPGVQKDGRYKIIGAKQMI